MGVVLSYGRVPYSGMIASDVLVQDASGAATSITTCTEDSTLVGRYTIVYSTLASGDYKTGLKGVGKTATQGYNTLPNDLVTFTI